MNLNSESVILIYKKTGINEKYISVFLQNGPKSSKMAKIHLETDIHLVGVYRVDFNCVEEYDGFRLIKWQKFCSWILER